jgi:GntR family transcriptional regulator/MocR family aminotransferase
LTVPLDPRAAPPLWQQLYDGLRAAILDGRLPPGTRLSSTRSLATELAVSRTTVLTAFEQLLAEGYIEGRVGSGSYVARALPEDLLAVQREVAPAPKRPQRCGSLSQRGALLTNLPLGLFQARGRTLRPFLPWTPALDAFPVHMWARLVARYWSNPPPELLGRGDPAGYRPLREAIAAYLGPARGVRCEPEQVIVVAGMQQAFDLAVRVLLDPDDVVWIEDPGYVGARGSFVAAGARVVPIPIDDEGIDVDAAMARHPAARLVYVTPSHQYPLGVTMSLRRRLALLDWASKAGAWVLEDDYDSEYRYAGRPLAALQGLDRNGCVIYLGTFDKVLFPALCLGYVVVPPDLVDVFAAARSLASRHAPSIDQAVVADFMTDGHFGRHIRRMRLLYAERQAALVEAASQQLSGLLEVRPSEAGMHLVGWLPEGVDDQTVAEVAAGRGLEAPPLSAHSTRPLTRGGLLLGYTAFTPAQIREAVSELARLLPLKTFVQSEFP